MITFSSITIGRSKKHIINETYYLILGAFKKYTEFSRDKSASKKKRILAC